MRGKIETEGKNKMGSTMKNVFKEKIKRKQTTKIKKKEVNEQKEKRNIKDAIHNMKLNKKIILGFSIVLLIAYIPLISSIYFLRVNNTRAEHALEYSGFAQGNIGKFLTEVQHQGAIVRDIISLTEKTEISAEIDNLDFSTRKLNKLIPQIEASLMTDKEKEIFVAVKKSLEQYTLERKEVLQLAAKNKDEEALIAFTKKAYPYIDSMTKDMERILGAKEEMGNSELKGMQNANRLTLLVIGACMLGSMIIAGVIAINLTRAISGPIFMVADAAKKMRQGQLDVQIDYTSSNEIGLMAQSMKEFTYMLNAIIKDIGYELKELGNGNLGVKSKEKELYIGDFAPLQESLEEIIEKFNMTLTQINQSAYEVSSGSEDIAKGATELAGGATEQASIIQEFVAATEEVSNHIHNNMLYVNKTSEMSGIAKEKANEGTQTMNKMLIAMDEINKSSENISEIIKIIDQIASQTNLLALNAAIEAARVGDVGRGFAVVASEIRDLANRSLDTVQQIGGIVQESMNKAKEGEKMAKMAASALDEIVVSVDETANIAGILLDNSGKQQEVIGQVVEGTKQLSEVLENTSATSEENAAISEELAAQAESLKQLIEYFKLDI